MRSGLTLTALLAVAPAWGADGADEDLRAKTQNPVGSLISVPFENNVDFGAPNGTAYILNFQPVIPVTVGNWNLISRPILPIAYVPGFIDGVPGLPSGSEGDGAFGLGDLNYSLFVSPAQAGKVIWGLGPSITFKTATNDQLGSGKWSAGPTAVVLTQPKPWSIGLLVRQLWSFAGDDDRADVSQFLMQPFVNYNFDGGWFLFSDPTITANWKADSGQKWTVPIGGGFGRVFNIGEQPVNMRLGIFGNVVRPDFAPKGALKFTVQLLFPK
jgi:hypothetical protein